MGENRNVYVWLALGRITGDPARQEKSLAIHQIVELLVLQQMMAEVAWDNSNSS